MVDRTNTIGLLAVVATVIATVSVTTQTRELAITHVSVIDVVEGRILPNSTVTISGKTSSSVTPDGAPRRGAQVVDAQGKFLIPGLWDRHARIEGTGQPWL